MNDQNNQFKQTEKSCGPGCNCGAPAAGARMKYVICGIVILAAVVVVAGRFTVKTNNAAQTRPAGYAATLPEVAKPAIEQSGPVAAVSNAWGTPLKSLADLNTAAADTEGVFIVLASSDSEVMAAIQKEILSAAEKIKSSGSRMGTYLLSQNAPEYAVLAQQVGVPAVIAMRKGLGSALVQASRITQENLMRAFVAASRPSTCCSSGSGPAGCN